METTGATRTAPFPDPDDPRLLHVERRGRGRPVVLIHGFGASSFSWRHWTGALSRRHRTLAVDLKGFGRAPKPRDGRYAPLDQARILRRLVLDEDLERVTLVGHSLGGAVALLTVLLLEDEGEAHRVERLVLISAAVYPQAFPRYMGILRVPALGRLLVALVPPRWILRKAIKEICYRLEEVPDDQVLGYARAYEDPDARLAVLESARQVLRDDPRRWIERYGEVTQPTLLLWGADDPVVPVDQARRLERDLPEARLVVIPDCGHLPPEEHPRTALAVVEDFLAESEFPDRRERISRTPG